MKLTYVSLSLLFFCAGSFNLLAQSKIGFTLGLAQYDTPKDIDNNLVSELEVLNSSYASIYMEFNFEQKLASKSTLTYSLGYSYAVLLFGIRSLSNSIGRSGVSGIVPPGFQRNGADYKLHYLTIGSDYAYYLKEKFKGFSISIGPEFYYQLRNNHRRARLLQTNEVVALPIEDKQRGLNKLAAHINLTVTYSILIKSLQISVGYQNAVRVRSFYSDIPIGNRYYSKGLFLGVHF